MCSIAIIRCNTCGPFKLFYRSTELALWLFSSEQSRYVLLFFTGNNTLHLYTVKAMQHNLSPHLNFQSQEGQVSLWSCKSSPDLILVLSICDTGFWQGTRDTYTCINYTVQVYRSCGWSWSLIWSVTSSATENKESCETWLRYATVSWFLTVYFG